MNNRYHSCCVHDPFDSSDRRAFGDRQVKFYSRSKHLRPFDYSISSLRILKIIFKCMKLQFSYTLLVRDMANIDIIKRLRVLYTGVYVK